MTTKSRIDKGLLAIPVSLAGAFPPNSGFVYLLGDAGEWTRKTFTANESSSKECRIGGMKEFYKRYDLHGGDELVIYALGDDRYQIMPEAVFQRRIVDLEKRLDDSLTQASVEAAFTEISAVTHASPDDVIVSEYTRLASYVPTKRMTHTRNDVRIREHIPQSLRKILTILYKGQCQVSGFTFAKKNGEPYFEVHHIDPVQGNHVKNVLVVSPNVHAQFTHASVENSIDESGWLRQVRFNGESFQVFQIIDQLPVNYTKVVHSI